jgi:hypothetical protein
MTALNKQALREAAEKATQGTWVEKCGEVTTADYDVKGVTFLDHICNCEIIGTESPNAEFIAAASPATVLALLDELEAAEKRIAELEARTITVKQFDDFQIVHYGGSEDYAKGYIDCQNNYNKALTAAGIGVKGE